MAPWRFFPAPGQKWHSPQAAGHVGSFWIFYSAFLNPISSAGIFPKSLTFSYQMIVPLPVCQVCYGFFLQLFGGNHFNEIVGNKCHFIPSSWQKRTCFKNAFSSVVQSLSRVRLCYPMNRSTPGLPVHHQLPEFTQTQVHQVGDAIQPSHPLSSPSPPAPIPSQHQSLFKWLNSSHEVAKVLEFQL